MKDIDIERKEIAENIDACLRFKETLTEEIKEEIIKSIKYVYKEKFKYVGYTTSTVTGFTGIRVAIGENVHYFGLQLKCFLV